MSIAPAQPIVRRLENLLRRAMDPNAPEPEAEISATMAVRTARRADLGYLGFVAAIAPTAQLSAPAAPRKPRRPPACAVEIPVGKHAGKTLAQIAREDIEYLAWVAAEWRSPDLRDAAEIVLDHFAGRAKA